MYFDFEDYRPDTPRVNAAISVREGVLLSIIVHLGFVIFLLLFPDALTRGEVQQVASVVPAPDREPLRFVEVVPFNDRPAPPIRPADQSDLDRRSSTIEQAPDADNAAPLLRGNSPELVEGGPTTPPAGGPPPAPPAAEATPLPTDDRARLSAADLARPTPQTPTAPGPNLGQSLRNLSQYLRDDQYDNPRGGLTDRSADIQFDSKGIDFGPWLRRFKNQVERNWLVPQAAMMYKTRVVVQFHVLRNGTITDLAVLEPAAIPALTSSALNALKLSNPTAQLPADYPADKVLFTVTFWYNLNPRDFR